MSNFKKDKAWSGKVTFVEEKTFCVLANTLEEAIAFAKTKALGDETEDVALLEALLDSENTDDPRASYSVRFSVYSYFTIPKKFYAPNLEVALAKIRKLYKESGRGKSENAAITSVTIYEAQVTNDEPKII